MNLKDIISQPTAKDLRVFAVLQFVFFCLIGFLLRGSLPAAGIGVVLVVSLLVAIAGCLRPAWVRPVYVGWMCAVFPIGWTISHIALGLVYYGVLTPIGIWRRRVAGDPMQREFDSSAETYWQQRGPSRKAESYFRQF
jgi:hypothetical protein